MKKIICQKPCTVGGHRFAIGDTGPTELIAPSRERTLVDYGLIAVLSLSDVPNTPNDEEVAETEKDAQAGQEPPTEQPAADSKKKAPGKKASG